MWLLALPEIYAIFIRETNSCASNIWFGYQSLTPAVEEEEESSDEEEAVQEVNKRLKVCITSSSKSTKPTHSDGGKLNCFQFGAILSMM